MALLCLGVVLLHAAADVLPDDPLVWVLTPVRLVLLAGLAAAFAGGATPGRIRNPPFDVAVGALLLAAAIATVAGGQDWSGWRGVLTAIGAFYLATAVQRSALASPAAVGLLALACVAVAAVVALRQFVAGTPTGFCRGAVNSLADVCGPGTLIRAVGTFGNPNLLAAFLVLALPLAAFGSAVLADRSSRLFGTAIVVLAAVAVLLTGSRGGVLGAVAGAGAALVLARPTRGRLIAAAAALAAVIGAFVLAAAGGSVGVRQDVWAAAGQLVVTHPLGVGPGRAGALIADLVPGDEDLQHAHNMWLNVAVESGWLGLAAMLAVTVLAGVGAVRAARRGSRAAVALGAGFAGFAVLAVVDHPAGSSRIALAMWLVLGLLAAETARRPAPRRPAGAASDPDVEQTVGLHPHRPPPAPRRSAGQPPGMTGQPPS